MARPQTYDHLRSQKKPTVETVKIALDTEIADEFQEAKDALERAEDRLSIRPEDPKLISARDEAKAKLEEIRPRMEETTASFKLKSIGRRRFEALLMEHPATPDQQEEEKVRTGMPLQWNPDTFPIALLDKSIIEPEMTEADVKEMWNSDEWSAAELNELLNISILVNQQRRIVSLGKD